MQAAGVTLPVGQIVTGDCLQVLKSFPDGCIDAVITDPPYGQDAGNTGASRGMTSVLATARDYGGFAWDKARPAPECFAEIIRVSKVQAIFGGNFFADLLPPTHCWYCSTRGGAMTLPTVSWSGLRAMPRRVSSTSTRTAA